MRNLVNSYVQKFKKERRERWKAAGVLLVLALLVAVGVSWQLHSTGIAKTNETYCGLEEHQHSEDCYESVLVCGQEESEGHTHSEECYEAVSTLVCGLEETEGHTHDDSCYDEEGNLICGLEEAEGHIHDDSCYETEEVLVCDLEEGEGHTHTEDCYEEQLVCGLEEHTHTVECLSDETADVETAEDWEATLPKDQEGTAAEAVVAIAESQLGYTESTKNFVLADDGETCQGYTRYGAWYGEGFEYVDWDALFAAFCVRSAGISEEDFPVNSGAYAWAADLTKAGLYADAADYTPEAGDLVFFDTDADGKADKVGIVEAVETEEDEAADVVSLTVVVGDYTENIDAADAVCSLEYDSDDEAILGYGLLSSLSMIADIEDENLKDGEDSDQEEQTQETTASELGLDADADASRTISYEGDDYKVDVTYGVDAGLPEDVEVSVVEYASDTEEFQDYYAQTAELYKWEEDRSDSVRLFDITLLSDGTEVEPEEAVQVVLTYLDEEESLGDCTVTHFGENGTETLEVTSEYADGERTMSFNMESFSYITVEATQIEKVSQYWLAIYIPTDSGTSQERVIDYKPSNSTALTDVYQYTESSETYYLIPIKYFADNLSSYNYSFNEYECPFYYTDSASDYEIEYATYQASYVQEGSSWYVRVQDLGFGTYTTYSGVPRTNVYFFPENVVLNLGNGNGISNNEDYSGGMSDGANSVNLRYTIDLTGASINNDGTITINLPSDNDLGTTFTVATATDGSAINQTLGKEVAYDYKLVGWYNIATGEYYNVENGSVTATIDLNYANVFYAEWIAASYDYGSSDDSNLIETADTSDFVTIHMFDYNELFNLYSASLEQNKLYSESWYDSGNLYEIPLLASTEATSSGKSFIFKNNRTNNSKNNLLGSVVALTGGNNVSAGETGTKNIVSSTSDEILKKLFNISAENTEDDLGVYYVGEGNYLFSYDSSDNMYSYDSAENAAAYNQSEQRFYVYDSCQEVKFLDNSSSIYTSFLPYNVYNENQYSTDGGLVNYYFGMYMEVDFYLPNDVATGGNKLSDGSEMIFNFSGDDDIWIFIDDELVLDMGGIHNLQYGSMNFSTGVTIIQGTDGKEIQNTTYGSLPSIGAGSHTIKVYYMERGAYLSNLKVEFNVVPRWKLESAIAGTMSVTKEWKDEDGNTITDTSTCPAVTMGLFEKTTVEVSSSATSATDGSLTYILTDGYSYDSGGMVNAYVSGGYLYVRIDTQELSNDNDWSFTWELLDEDKTYEVLELTALPNYKVTSDDASLQSYDYWCAVDSEDLNGAKNSDGYRSGGILEDRSKILLTDGAQNGTENIDGYTSTYTGYAIDSSDGTILTALAYFSQKATYDEVDGVYTYGVTADAYIEETSVWIVKLTGSYHSTTINGATEFVPAFYLIDSNGNYLAVTEADGNYSLTTVSDLDNATTFSYNGIGELTTGTDTEYGGLKVIIDQDGNYDLADNESAANEQNVKIYVKKEMATVGRSYTVTNTKLPTVTLKKVDSTNSEATLDGAVFTLQSASGAYYSYDSVNDEVVWSSELIESNKLTTGNDGTIHFNILPDGTYTLREITAPDGYNLLSSSITFVIEDGIISSAYYGDGSVNGMVDVDTDTQLVITVKNTPGYELPSAGSIGTTPFTCAGLILTAGSVAGLMYWQKRRKRKVS